MAARIDLVTFSEKPPTVQEIADQVSKLTGLDVRVDQDEISNRPSIAFEAIPNERISFRTLLIPGRPGSSECLILDYATVGATLLVATSIALESLGGDPCIPRVSEKYRRKYSGKTTVDELLRRHRWEQRRRNFVLRPIAYLVASPFLAIFGMLWMTREAELKWQKHHPLSYAKKDRSIAINRGVPGGWSQNEAKR